jgi:DNA repair protein RecN (Recombination protein N)
MLISLRIRDLAIVHEVELALGPGLNVITGETGAGKSILVSALELVLGGRAGTGLVRSGADQAEVEALFEVTASVELCAELSALGVELAADETELVLRRVVFANGRTRSHVNGRLVTNAQLKQLALGLADISSQHEHHTLTNSATHLSYLDAYGALTGRRVAMSGAYDALRHAKLALEQFQARERAYAERSKVVADEIAEIETAAPRPGEDAELEAESHKLRQTEALERLVGGASELLYERDSSLVEQLVQAERQLREATRLDPALHPYASQLESCRVELEDAARQLRRYVDSLSAQPESLAQVEARLYLLGRLKRKYGGSLQAVVDYLSGIRVEREELEDCACTSERLTSRLDLATQEASEVAFTLSAQRKSAAKRLGAAIGKELHSLGMGSAEVVVEVAGLDARGGDLTVGGQRLTQVGIDRAELLIAPNRGEAARPLATIASGGELSRAMLAIKRVLADLGPAGMYVFDEVDSGVGGATAEVIGRKIRSVAKHRQVVCITHLAPIAVFADQHFLVSKRVVDGRTTSEVRKLTNTEQTEEVARMLGGLKITKNTRATAREMIRDARATAA